MSLASWRATLLALCLIAIIVNAVAFFTDGILASTGLGFQVSRTADPAVVRVDAVDAGGAAEASGLRAGDLINVRELAPGQRYRLLTGVYPHEKIALRVLRAGVTVPIEYVAGGPPPWRWDVWLSCFADFWILGFAALIGWRRADVPEARVLCLLLVSSNIYAALDPGSWIGPSPLADAIAAGIGIAALAAWAALLATFASLVARPLSRVRIALVMLAYASAAAFSAFEIVRLVALWNGWLPWVAQSLGPEWNMTDGAVPFVLAIACAWASFAATRGAERSRVAWILLPLTIWYAFEALSFVAPSLWPNAQRGSALITAYALANVGSFIAPLGMTYALFNRRVLDIGFALNRVAIFSGVSIVVVGAFVLVEWALGSWLQETSHTTSLAVGAVVALLLGFSIRFVHDRVEHLLDRAFFRKRHEDEEAIRRFAREAAYVTDPAIVIERTVGVLERHAGASFVALALTNGNGKYGAVGENDPAIVSLRTWHRKLDLHGVDTQLRGEFAYPMVSRGRLIGALVLGPKRSQESYAPDESDAIEDLAHHVGGALDVLGHVAGGDEPVLAELKAVRRAIADGFQSLQSTLENGTR
ncbi:MAG TPA: hypothetical protein VMF11_02225 [Candidatus Baltobacteraceae bacterium]|nr:hypothetical protein [Candidatus Baltobacteraceae bacterium]